ACQSGKDVRGEQLGRFAGDCRRAEIEDEIANADVEVGFEPGQGIVGGAPETEAAGILAEEGAEPGAEGAAGEGTLDRSAGAVPRCATRGTQTGISAGSRPASVASSRSCAQRAATKAGSGLVPLIQPWP